MKQKIRDWLTQQFGNDEALFAELYSQYEGDICLLYTSDAADE